MSASHRVITLNRLEGGKKERERDKGVKDKSGGRYSSEVKEKGEKTGEERENMMYCSHLL